MVWEYPHKHVSLMPNIDSHQHFWQYHPVQHDWINDEMAIIRKDFLPSDLRTVLQENNMDGCVAVQADQTETETDFLVGLTKENDFIKGIVGWVNLRADEIRERLVHYKQFDSIKGFRHILQGEEPSFMLQADFMRGIAALKEFGFTYDILVFPKHLTAATALVKKNPDQLFVIDHIAKPDIKNGQIDKWKKDIQTIAQFENLYCKISSSNRETYSFDPVSHEYNQFDSLFSNDYKNTYNSNRFTISYRLQNPKYNFNLSSGLQSGNRTSINTTKNITTEQNFLNLTPTGNFQYNFTRTKSLRLFYTGRTGQPSVSQLQPLVTTSDSINFSRGNPNLKQQFTHSIRLLYNNFDVVTQRVIMITLNASMISNDIQNSITYLPTPPNKKGATLTVPVNLNGTYNVSGYFNYGFPLKKPKSNLNFTSNVSYNQSQTLVNSYDANQNLISINNFTRNTALNETVRWTTNLKNNFDMNLSSSSTYNIARNSMQPTLNANSFIQTVSVDVTVYTNNGWILASDFDYAYTFNNNAASGYNTSVPLWNPSFAKQFMKNKAGELRLTCFDLLNQNQSVKRSVSQSGAVTDTRSNVLTRYLMLTFTYNLRKFAGAQQKMPSFMRGMNRPGGGGGMRGGGGFGGAGKRGG